MRIAPQSIGVGKFMVLSVKVVDEESHVVRYWNDYENALKDAHERWYEARDKGYIFLVVEVQGIIANQAAPCVTTKLTEKL